MLSNSSIEAVKPLADDLIRRGIRLMPVTGSPLEAMVRESLPGFDGTTTPQENAVDYAACQLYDTANSAHPGTEIRPHDMVVDETVPVLAEAVRNHIAHARTVVNPYIEKLVTEVNEQIKDLSPSSLLGMEVIVYNPAAPFINPVFENSIKGYRDVAYEAGWSMDFMFPDTTTEELTKLLKTNSVELDADIDNWLSGLGENFLLDVWSGFFQAKQTPNLHSFITDTVSTAGVSGLNVDKLLAIHLLARNLYDHPMEGMSVSLVNYNRTITLLKNISGARLLIESEQYYKEKDGDQILIRSLAGSKIVVNGAVYKKWIADGGDNDILFGNALVSFPVFSVAKINERKDALRTEWNRHSALVTMTEAKRRVLRLRGIFLNTFKKLIVEDTEPNLNREQMYKQCEEFLSSQGDEGFTNFFLLARKLVCRIRFPETDAEEILSSIDKVAQANPNMDIREAATIAVICHVANWQAHQMKAV